MFPSKTHSVIWSVQPKETWLNRLPRVVLIDHSGKIAVFELTLWSSNTCHHPLSPLTAFNHQPPNGISRVHSCQKFWWSLNSIPKSFCIDSIPTLSTQRGLARQMRSLQSRCAIYKVDVLYQPDRRPPRLSVYFLMTGTKISSHPRL